ncbi:MAG TPA: 50S ribosomal protein L29 [Rhodothermales bacterium]
MRFQHSIASLPNPMSLRQKRRELARLKTLLKEKQA